MRFYKVQAKCGHVGRGHYVIKDFFVRAENGKEAAHKVRFCPRVKHDWKYAIVSVTPIDRDEFVAGWNDHNQDLYFHITNSSDQRMMGAIDYESVLKYEEHKTRKKDRNSIYYNKMERIQRRDLRTYLAEII